MVVRPQLAQDISPFTVIGDRLQKTLQGMAMVMKNQRLLHEPELISQPLESETEIRLLSAGFAETLIEQSGLDQRFSAKTRVCGDQVSYRAVFVKSRVQHPDGVGVLASQTRNGASYRAAHAGYPLIVKSPRQIEKPVLIRQTVAVGE